MEKQKAIDYACQRFGGFLEGEVHVYANDGLTIEQVIIIDGWIFLQFSQPRRPMKLPTWFKLLALITVSMAVGEIVAYWPFLAKLQPGVARKLRA